jgi:hypothetical protein
MKTPMGKSILRQLNKKLTNDIPTLKGKKITNKIKWGIAILKNGRCIGASRIWDENFKSL